MKKTLICVENLEQHICRAGGKLYLNGAILTPGARDELAKRRIAVLPGPCPDVSSCPLRAAAQTCLAGCGEGAGNGGPAAGAENAEAVLARLTLGIAAVLKKDYGVTDPTRIQELAFKAIQVVRDNI